MELPAALRSAVDQMLSGEPLEKLVAAHDEPANYFTSR